MSDEDPAQRQFVKRYIDWQKVESRLERFHNIATAFPLNRMRSCNAEPYFCHYMAWRLGTWNRDELFERFDELLGAAQDLPNWPHEQGRLGSVDFSDFWSDIWPLQMAEYLRKIGSGVSWHKSGPDLSVDIDGAKWFVECYVYRKSFGLTLFLREVLERIDPSIRVVYNLCKPLNLPTDNHRLAFLDSVLSPFLDPGFIEGARLHSANAYPDVLYQQEGGLTIYYEGSDVDAYTPCIVREGVGDTDEYLRVALREAVRAKQSANRLSVHRPNLLAVNFLVSTDFQTAVSRADYMGLSLPRTELGDDIDALVIGAVGIDESIDRSGLRLAETSRLPRERLLQTFGLRT